jgi:hypothetical protein
VRLEGLGQLKNPMTHRELNPRPQPTSLPRAPIFQILSKILMCRHTLVKLHNIRFHENPCLVFRIVTYRQKGTVKLMGAFLRLRLRLRKEGRKKTEEGEGKKTVEGRKENGKQNKRLSKNIVFWNVTPCSLLAIFRRSSETWVNSTRLYDVTFQKVV